MKSRALIVLAGAAVLAGCSPGINRPVREVTATMGPGDVQHAHVTAHSFWFEPNRVVVKRGISVELTVQNGSFIVPHDFSCEAPDAGIDVDLRLGMFHGSRKTRFTPTRAGEYHFHCDVDGHAKKGMMGMLVVVEP